MQRHWAALRSFLSLTWSLLGAWWGLSPAARVALLQLAQHARSAGFTDQVSRHLAAYGALSPLQQRVADHVQWTLADRHWPEARNAVTVTATTLGLNKPHAWDELANTVKSQPQWAENMWRHVHAVKLFHKRITHANRQMRNPDINLLVELAYVSYAIQPKD